MEVKWNLDWVSCDVDDLCCSTLGQQIFAKRIVRYLTYCLRMPKGGREETVDLYLIIKYNIKIYTENE